MYLAKNSNNIVIKNYEDIITRYVKQIMLITNGVEENNCIIFSFDEKKVLNLIDFLDSNYIDYETDDNLNIFLENRYKILKDFQYHSDKALEIKNNLSSASKGYVEFINIISREMKRSLYEHQLKAAYHMAFSLNSCNFSVPGSGKTTIVYAAYTYLKALNKVDKLFIIGPLSSNMAWKNEYYECFNESPDFINLNSYSHTDKRQYFRKFNEIQAEITFLNYEGLNNLGNDMNDYLAKNKVMIILDEAHKIKNPKALRAKNVLNFSKKANSKVILTGTPIPNGYIDLYNLFEFIWPNKNIIGYNPNQLKRINESSKYNEDVKQLMENINPFYIRISKNDLGLPKANFNNPIVIQMGNIQRVIYDFIADDFLKSDYKYRDYDLRMELKKSKLIRLMQALTNPGAICQSIDKTEFDDSEMFNLICNYNQIELAAKYSAALDLVKKIISQNGKVIIWTQFVYNITALKSYFENNNISSELLFGEVDNITREDIIMKFHKDTNLKVLIANPAAVAESISLHKVCHNAIYLDMSFNASHYMQSKDRIHRVGLKPNDKINYYFLHSENSIDDLIFRRVLQKENIMLDVIEGKEVPLFSKDFASDLSESDIEIVRDYLVNKRAV